MSYTNIGGGNAMNRLKNLREERNIKQLDLAKVINVSQGTLSNWERGIHDPDHKSLVLLTEIFGVTTDYLLGKSSNPTPSGEPSLEEALHLKGVKDAEHIKMIEQIIDMMAKKELSEETAADLFLEKESKGRQIV